MVLRIRSDAALVKRALRGYESAFTELFNRYYASVVRYCYPFTSGDLGKADDLAQETFIAAFNSLHKLRDTKRFKSYLLSICSRSCLNYKRSEKRYGNAIQRYTIERFEDGEDESPLLRERKISLVSELIDSIDNERERSILKMYYTDFNLKTREIAKKLAIPHGTVTVTLKRARHKIQKQLARELTRLEEQAA